MRQADKDEQVRSLPLSLRLDATNAQAWQGEHRLKLTPKAFAVLHSLALHPGQLVTKEELMQTVWADTVVTDGALVACIRELRKALNDDVQAPRYIETVHRRGYRFLGEVVSSQQSVVRREESKHGAWSGEQRGNGNPSVPAPNTQHPALLLVGRDAELAQLHQWFAKARNGERQIVFITGEPGIGKTTLVEGFLNSLASRVQGQSKSRVQRLQPSLAPSPQPLAPGLGVAVGKGQCIEHYGAGEAYLPVLEALGRLCRGADGEQLVMLLHEHAPTWLVQLPALLDTSTLEALQRKTQGATRERMLRELTEALEVITIERPLILVLEDLHWSDPSTLDLLSMLARRIEPARLLILGTYRPIDVIVHNHPLKTVKVELQLHGHCQELALELLSEAAIVAYLVVRFDSIVGAQHAASLQTLAQALHSRTEGNPLFLVAMVEDLITRGVITETETGWEIQADTIETHIPESIRQLVTLQSARLPADVQRTLEAASIAGMEFSAASVTAALSTDTIAIERHCEQLTMHRHFLRRVGVEAWPDGTLAARYSFLHALYQQLWHERVSPTQLQHYHLRIGERKERAYGEHGKEIAAELAVHFEQGRQYEKAIQYLELAARNALRQSAYHEGISLLNKGLTLLKTLPETLDHVQQELRLQMMLTTPLIALRGYTALEVEQACVRARTLCAQTGETPRLFSVLGGLFSLHYNRGQLQTALEVAQQLLDLAQKTQDQRALLWAHYTLGVVFEDQGLRLPARSHFEQSVALYDPQQRSSSYSFAQNPGTTGLARLAWVLYSLGYPDQALQKIQDALSLARQLAQPFSLMNVLTYAAEIHDHRGEHATALALEEELFALSHEHGFVYWSTEGAIRRAWKLTRQRQVTEGLEQLHRAVTALQSRGEEIAHPYALYRLADAYGYAGKPEEGLHIVTKGFAIARRQGRILWEANFYHQQGTLILQQFNAQSSKCKAENPHSAFHDPQVEAEACFLKALELARQQQTKSDELEIGLSLARLWHQQGKTKKAHKMLSDIYHWFTEGFDTKDLQEAKALLDELQDAK